MGKLGLLVATSACFAITTPTRGQESRLLASLLTGDVATKSYAETFPAPRINRVDDMSLAKAFQEPQLVVPALTSLSFHRKRCTNLKAAYCGSRSFAADGANGRSVHWYKLLSEYRKATGRRVTERALNPKHAGMEFIMHPDGLAAKEVERRRVKLKVRRRSVPLSEKWKSIGDLLEEDQLVDEPKPGARVSRAKHIGNRGTRWSQQMRSLAQSSRTVVIALVKTADFGKSVVITVSQYREGSLDYDMMLAKTALQAGELAWILFSTPEPTMTTKVLAVVVEAGSMLIDMSLERIVSRRIAARRQLLENIDRNERYRAVLNQLSCRSREVGGLSEKDGN